MSREVTEKDLRMPEYRCVEPHELEFRDDGKIVRKDRWEMGMHQIASLVGFSVRGGYEIPDVIAKVAELVDAVPLASCQADRDGDCIHAKCPQLADGEPRATGRHCPLDTPCERMG
ncbi:hypothetical protein [Aquabacterium sp.]|uniref:hypothetical protein n=1 Tax=Aquabacterium sp. TaxID=1872578 RepID=UPI0035C6A4C8